MRYFLSFFIFLFLTSAQAKDLSLLFIGNSYTYLPTQGTPDDPGLPKLIKQIAESIDPTLNISYRAHTRGGYSFMKHYNDPQSVDLMSKKYDKVVLQGNSIESLDLPPWADRSELGEKYFAVYLPKVLSLVLQNNRDITFYVNWGWNLRHGSFKDGNPELYFPPGSSKAGQKWCGKDKYDLQRMINESYERHTARYTVKLSKVGDGWLAVQDAGIVNQDELYIPEDWSHASPLGAFVAALILARDVLGLDISKNQYIPSTIDPAKAKALQAVLAKENGLP